MDIPTHCTVIHMAKTELTKVIKQSTVEKMGKEGRRKYKEHRLSIKEKSPSNQYTGLATPSIEYYGSKSIVEVHVFSI